MEKQIRDIQDQTRKQLHHAKARWPSAVELALFPYALRQATHFTNWLPDKEDASSPLDRFSKTSVAPKLRENHSFGYLIFALQNSLTGGRGGVPKWKPRARLGINLGPSPRHMGLVWLIINLQTEIAYPQFHLSYDDFFEAVRPTAGNPHVYSNWQALAVLRKYEPPVREPKSSPSKRSEHPDSIITQDAPIPPSQNREE